MFETGQTCSSWRAFWTGVLSDMNSEMKDSLAPLDMACVEDVPTIDGSQGLTMIPKVKS